MKRLSRVLCAVAIDERDRAVFEQALALARRHDARLLLLHAASPDVAFNRGATERVDFLRRLRALAEAAAVEIRVDVQTGPTAELILLHARAREVDLIVLGAGHRHERRRGLSGWIAERVLRDAPCPTLVVPRTPRPSGSFAEAILCAVDFSPAADAALQEAVRMSQEGVRPMTLLHVVSGADDGGETMRGSATAPDDRRGRTADALGRLQSLIPPPARARVTVRVVTGRPAAAIIRAVESTQATLLVIGAAPRTRFGSRLFGKTGQLLRDASCPVLAVPAPAVPQTGRRAVLKRAA